MILCNTCGSTRIGITEIGGDMMGWHPVPYCIACKDKESYPGLSKGETLDQHTHSWEARNGRFGGFIYCTKCKQTMSAAEDEQLFRKICTYKAETIEKVIAKAHRHRSFSSSGYRPVPWIRASASVSGVDSGYNDISHDWDEPGSYGGDGYNDPFYYGGDDGG